MSEETVWNWDPVDWVYRAVSGPRCRDTYHPTSASDKPEGRIMKSHEPAEVTFEKGRKWVELHEDIQRKKDWWKF
jgi:hypothetical protein